MSGRIKQALLGLVACAALAATAAHADEGALGKIPGNGTLTVRGTTTEVKAVWYMHTSTTGRTSFTVMTATGSISFSGSRDLQPFLTHYTLLVDSMITDRHDEEMAARMPAKGTCDMLLANSTKAILRHLTCTAKTEFGIMRLDFAGDGNASSAAAIPGL